MTNTTTAADAVTSHKKLLMFITIHYCHLLITVTLAWTPTVGAVLFTGQIASPRVIA